MSRRTYVDNASNRSLGRVGMSYGSASASGSSVGSLGSSFQRCYVDNSQNRSLGRVGLPLGSAVHSRSSVATTERYSSSSEPSTYVDNSLNRSLGRVGLPLGSAVHSRSSVAPTQRYSSSSEPSTYVDNSLNRSLGRVGLPLGSAVHSRSSSSQLMASSLKTYVDNAYNRRLGRVGQPKGSAAVHSNLADVSVRSTVSSNTKTYVDNAKNRKLQRVGLPLGSAKERTNRKLGPDGSMLCSAKERTNWENLQQLMLDHAQQLHNQEDVWQQLAKYRNDAVDNEDVRNIDQFEEILHRQDAAKVQRTRLPKSTMKFDGHVIDFAELELGDKIGSGGFADVHVAIWRNDFQVAVKKLSVQRVSQARKTEFENEAQLLSSLKHPAVVTLYGACIQTPNLALVMEFMPKGSLHDLLFVESSQLSDTQKKSMIKDSLSALDYIHARLVTHRDIKSRNILVCENLTNCKLSDFGLALKDYSETSSSVTTYQFVGTIKYSPPEVLSGDRLNLEQLMAADIYSMALTIVELISEEEPFDRLNQNQVRKAVLAGEIPSIADVPVGFREVIKKCLGEAQQRPSASAFFESYLSVKDKMWNEA